MTEPNVPYHKDSPEFANLVRLGEELQNLILPLGYQKESFMDERGHVIAIVKVMGEYTGDTWEEATEAAIRGMK